MGSDNPYGLVHIVTMGDARLQATRSGSWCPREETRTAVDRLVAYSSPWVVASDPLGSVGLVSEFSSFWPASMGT